MSRTFVCVGDVMTDVVARLSGALVRGSDSPAPVALSPGGSAANTAAWLAAVGEISVFVGRVGADEAGDAAVFALQRAGVTTHVTRDAGLPTGTCIVLVSPDAERTMVPDAGANSALAPGDVPTHLFGPTTHVHVSGYSLLNAGSRSAARAALDAARSAGSSISVDPASAGPLTAIGPGHFLTWIANADALLANEDEARVLTGCTDAADAATALTEAFPEVVVKLGPAGALWAGRGVSVVVHVPAVPAQVVDSTGAGDAFAAGWLPAALMGAAPDVALAAGCALAARAITQIGARPPHA